MRGMFIKEEYVKNLRNLPLKTRELVLAKVFGELYECEGGKIPPDPYGILEGLVKNCVDCAREFDENGQRTREKACERKRLQRDREFVTRDKSSVTRDKSSVTRDKSSVTRDETGQTVTDRDKTGQKDVTLCPMGPHGERKGKERNRIYPIALPSVGRDGLIPPSILDSEDPLGGGKTPAGEEQNQSAAESNAPKVLKKNGAPAELWNVESLIAYAKGFGDGGIPEEFVREFWQQMEFAGWRRSNGYKILNPQGELGLWWGRRKREEEKNPRAENAGVKDDGGNFVNAGGVQIV